MSRKKILVTGASGLLGSAVCELYDGEIYGLYNTTTSEGCIENRQVDIRNFTRVREVCKDIRPDHIIHSAALINVEKCEKRKQVARDINVTGVKNIINAAKSVGSTVTYISSSYVYSGRKGPYTEEDQPDPINQYGKTKYAGEQIVNQTSDNLILRFSSLFGTPPHNKSNFVSQLSTRLQNDESIELIDNQYLSPIWVKTAARCILNLIKRDTSGIRHITNGSCVTRYKLGEIIADELGSDKSLLQRAKLSDFDFKAKKPINSCLRSVYSNQSNYTIPALSEDIAEWQKEVNN